ncbi:rRNA maturation RNase YbeY [Rickettsia endosymbiont of Cardiosporidium cionae]|uniref:rRNA maturation RNase YbeY n=1 Tax=Rickettsia endosymbiont of Cardiosporidium cionae TaxID=2777155 RepID=UPI001895E5E4|nr:rRNA maturation RNase YbeY [Rickettsia endosymbiont of Cardiosporidium cionae]KAF8818882.1 rRNA maturation RNase YbeY [Rickettsia endosymbiont of Cardiosporidium cionae]
MSLQFYNIEISVEEKRWRDYSSQVNKKTFRSVLSSVASRLEPLGLIKELELSVLLSHDKRLLKLNSEFRNKNSITNVLSFPDSDINYKGLSNSLLNQNYLYLGDIAFSYECIMKESQDYNLKFIEHFLHLLVHGILHLIGYDHNSISDAKAMQSLETSILKDFSIISPYC